MPDTKIAHDWFPTVGPARVRCARCGIYADDPHTADLVTSCKRDARFVVQLPPEGQTRDDPQH